MKIANPNLNVEISGINSKINKAEIVANPLLFQLLFGTLYKNKIESVVREILANAKDASVECKSKIPIEIHIPTLLEPWFSIKDYGVGMDSATIVDVFGNFGSSTKQKSNKYIGAFGLGAKTCYQMNQFSVSSNKNGTNNVYQFFIDKDGSPSNVQVHKGKTTEHNGTEIKIAVNDAKDFSEFEQCVTKYAIWIGHPVKCNKPIDFTKPEFEYIEKHFAITKHPIASSIVVAGGIPYDFHWSDITGYQYGNSLRVSNPVRDTRIVYFADIGDIDFTASREECKYSDKTKAFFLQVNKEVNEWYKELLKDKTKFWIHQNAASWESNSRGYFNYGFPIVSKSFRKWRASNNDQIYQKYISVDKLTENTDEIKRINWLQAISKVGGDSKTVAFVDTNNVAALIKLGCDPANIIPFSSLPKRKQGKKKAYRILYAKPNGGLGFTRVDSISGETFNIHDSNIKGNHYGYYARQRERKILEIMQSGVTITADPAKPCELMDWVKKKYGEFTSVTYCNVVDLLEKFDMVKKLTSTKNPPNFDLLREFGLTKGEHVDVSKHFPLVRGGINLYSQTEREHAKYYVDWVIKQNKDALNNKHLKVL